MIEKESSILLKSNQLCEKCGHRSRAIWTTNEHCYSCLDHKNMTRTFAVRDQRTVKHLEWDGDLPKDYCAYDAPKIYVDWLKQYGLWNDLGWAWMQNKVCWSASLDRLVFPIYHEGVLKCYQARALDRKPKWITCSPEYTWGKRFPLMLLYDDGRPIVLCEDIISCYRINSAGFSAIALLGCHANKGMLNFILRFRDNFIVWMDGDKAGTYAGAVLEGQLRLVAVVKRIKTLFDPKVYSINEIQEIINELN